MKDVVRAIEGVGLYPCISLIVFVLFFTTMLLWAFSLRSKQLHTMSNLPLEDDNPSRSGEDNHAG